MKKQWSLEIDGLSYKIDFSKSYWSGRRLLQVNGQVQALPKQAFQALVGMDHPFTIGGKECHLVVVGNKADLATDGKYLDSGKPYVPLGKAPWWSWVFVVACVAMPIVAGGGAFPVALALLGSMYCMRASVSPGMKTPVKVLLCLGIALLAWALFALILFAMAYLSSSATV